ncbi:glycosyltransferase [Marinimicrobium alkaliphilum]|uniref:glycosyltransferase n=1 Tax=Marinimicrobium alkaliphilum TaxID=2202654 RepID=UPI000DB92090|nr:glycosyltransferase [Marinimicrobium alkaliphilum]
MAEERSRAKVLHVISGDLWAGAEAQVYALIKQLSVYCEVHVAVLNFGRLSEELERLEVNVYVLDERQLSSWKIFRALIRLIKTIKPTIIHTHRQKENILAALANLLTVRAACLRTVHGAPEYDPSLKQRLQVLLDHWVGRFCQKAIIAVSCDLAMQLEKTFSSSSVHVIANGVDVHALKQFRKPATGVSGDPIRVVMAGRLEPVKRVDIFLQMAKRLNQGPLSGKLEFHIYGDGSQREMLEPYARTSDGSDGYSSPDNIHWHGHTNEILRALSESDLLVMCSDHEGMPMVALEALAIGIPVIAHSVGGLKDILSEYPDLLVSDHAPKGYAIAIENIVPSLPSYDVELNPNYAIDCCAEKTMSLYRNLVNPRVYNETKLL